MDYIAELLYANIRSRWFYPTVSAPFILPPCPILFRKIRSGALDWTASDVKQLHTISSKRVFNWFNLGEAESGDKDFESVIGLARSAAISSQAEPWEWDIEQNSFEVYQVLVIS